METSVESTNVRLYSYVVTHDTGFSPNPFFGYCTLACCKPSIRRSARPGDWIAGLTPKSKGNQLIYAMKVREKLTFEDYWDDPRFETKKPAALAERRLELRGDNIYQPLKSGRYRQLKSRHSDGDEENLAHKRRDLGGRHVLISDDFYYFGSSPRPLPEELSSMATGRGHKCRFPPAFVKAFERWIRHLDKGVQAHPTIWSESDTSWRDGTRTARCG